ncbi:MAG: S9 family peptidase [Acidobacteriota bacterium]
MILIWLAVLAAVSVLGGDQPLTLERIFSEPTLEGAAPKEVKWAPDGRRLSFIERSSSDAQVLSTLVVEDARTGTRELVVPETELGSFGPGKAAVRPRLAGYSWSPRGDALLLSGDGELFLLDLATRKASRLTSTAAEEELAQISPDGAWVAFVRTNDLFALRLADGIEFRLSSDGSPERFNGKLDWVYQEELAGADTQGFVWSPDSRTIAFITLDETEVPTYPLTDLLPVHPATRLQHYPKAGDPNPAPGLVVAELAGGPGGANRRRTWRWSGEDAPYLPRFGFTPDGSVWYELLNRAQTRLELVRETPGGGATTLLEEEDSAWVNLHDDLHFLADGRFIWTSERSGFRHLYLHDAGGRLIRQLTSGRWEVTELEAVDESGGWIYFTATEKSVLERHLYRASLDGAAFTRLTVATGTHDAEVGPSCQLVLDKHSTCALPPSFCVLDSAGEMVRPDVAAGPCELSRYALGKPELLTLTGPSGAVLHASLLKPRNFDPAHRYPVVVHVYGGPHAQVVRSAWGGRNELFHNYLVSRGLLVFSLDNRGAAAHGREMERTLLRRLGKAELEDQLAGVKYLRSLPFVDAERIGIWGWSYGGYMTCYALANAPDVFAAGAAVAPVTDWRLYDSIYTERYLKLPVDNPDGYRDSSPVNQAAQLRAPLLLIHGTGDDNVHWQNTLALIDRLYQAGKPYDLQLYANKNHGIPGNEAHLHLYRRIAEHFERHLRR